jgi:hypothetical protein
MNDAAHDKLLELGRWRRSRIAGSSDGRRHLGSVRLYETAKADGSWSGQRETSVYDWHWGTAPECHNFIWFGAPDGVIVYAEINPDGVVRLTYRDQRSPKQDARSHCRHRIPPFARRFGSKDPQRWSRDEMALKIEGVVDRGMHAEEALGRSSRFEPLHLALSSPYRLMRILGAIVLPEPLLMGAGQL